MTRLDDLAAFVCGASTGALPDDERAIQRRHVVDTVVAAVAGQRCRETAALAPLFGDRIEDRIAKLAASIRLTEIDDIHLPSCTTPSSVVIPVALGLAIEDESRRSRVTDALWVGTEIMTRFGTAVRGPDILYREVWPTYLCAPLTSAATAARMLGLSPKQTVHALSIALTLSAGGSGRFRQELSPRWLLQACAVRDGIVAAKAAQQGFAGDGGLLDREWLKESHGIVLDIGTFLDTIGGTPSAYTGLSIKPYCSAKQPMAAVEALRQIVAGGVAVDSIRSVVVKVPAAYVGMIGGPIDPGNRATTFASVRYQMALTLFRPDSLYDVVREGMPLDEPMARFMEKVSVERDDALAAGYPRRWPGKVVVDAGGQTIERTVLDAPGDPGARLDDVAVSDKAARVLDPAVGAEARTDWIKAASDALGTSRDAWKRLKMLVF
jgi:2-methylcitrate dehydratase PrpD